MAIRFEHQLSGAAGAAAYAAGVGRRRQRQQDRALTMFMDERRHRARYGGGYGGALGTTTRQRLSQRSTRAQLTQQPEGVWTDPLADDESLAPEQRMQRKGMRRSRARKYRMGQGVPSRIQPTFTSQEEIDTKQELADEAREFYEEGIDDRLVSIPEEFLGTDHEQILRDLNAKKREILKKSYPLDEDQRKEALAPVERDIKKALKRARKSVPTAAEALSGRIVWAGPDGQFAKERPEGEAGKEYRPGYEKDGDWTELPRSVETRKEAKETVENERKEAKETVENERKAETNRQQKILDLEKAKHQALVDKGALYKKQGDDPPSEQTQPYDDLAEFYQKQIDALKEMESPGESGPGAPGGASGATVIPMGPDGLAQEPSASSFSWGGSSPISAQSFSWGGSSPSSAQPRSSAMPPPPPADQPPAVEQGPGWSAPPPPSAVEVIPPGPGAGGGPIKTTHSEDIPVVEDERPGEAGMSPERRAKREARRRAQQQPTMSEAGQELHDEMGRLAEEFLNPSKSVPTSVRKRLKELMPESDYRELEEERKTILKDTAPALHAERGETKYGRKQNKAKNRIRSQEANQARAAQQAEQETETDANLPAGAVRLPDGTIWHAGKIYRRRTQ